MVVLIQTLTLCASGSRFLCLQLAIEFVTYQILLAWVTFEFKILRKCTLCRGM